MDTHTHTHLNFTRLSRAGERREEAGAQWSAPALVLVCHVRMCATLLQFCPGIVSMRSSVAVSCHVHAGVSYSPPLSLCLLLSASVCRVASFSFNYSCCFNKRCAAFGHFIKRQAPPASSPSFLVDFAATFWGNQSPGKCTYEHTESTERERVRES